MSVGSVLGDQPRAELERRQNEGLSALLAEILPEHRFYARKLAERGLSPSRLSFPRDRAVLPFTTKGELLAAQASEPPHGGLISYPFARYTRMHQTSGTTTGQPLRWYDTTDSWSLLLDCWLEKFRIARLAPEDHLFFPFSFGPYLGFWTAFEAASRYGCLCLSGGGMSSSARLRFLLANAVTVIFCTPTYALRLLEVADAEGIDLRNSPVRALIVAGEPGGSIPTTRSRIEAGWGARVFDHNGMTETGPLGFECIEAPAGLHILEGAIWAEIIDPITEQPVPAGTEGELVITSFCRLASPLIRYRTGDIVCADPSPCPCGRGLLRLDGGIRGRADDMLVIRGNNVHPGALQTILHRFEDVAEFQIEIDETKSLTLLRLRVEPKVGVEVEALPDRIEQAIRSELLFRPEIVLVPPDSLPRAEMKSRRVVRKTTPSAADDPGRT